MLDPCTPDSKSLWTLSARAPIIARGGIIRVAAGHCAAALLSPPQSPSPRTDGTPLPQICRGGGSCGILSHHPTRMLICMHIWGSSLHLPPVGHVWFCQVGARRSGCGCHRALTGTVRRNAAAAPAHRLAPRPARPRQADRRRACGAAALPRQAAYQALSSAAAKPTARSALTAGASRQPAATLAIAAAAVCAAADDALRLWRGAAAPVDRGRRWLERPR